MELLTCGILFFSLCLFALIIWTVDHKTLWSLKPVPWSGLVKRVITIIIECLVVVDMIHDNELWSPVQPACLGKFSKGHLNENGERLLEIAEKHKLFLSNTMFYHKMSHRWTWECPERIKDHIDRRSGEIRRNKYRNQIDFIFLRNSNTNFVTTTRSHGNLRTNTDHKLVRMSMSLKLYKCYNKTQKLNSYDTRKLISSNQTKNKYQEKQNEVYIQSIDKINNKSPQEIWNAVAG